MAALRRVDHATGPPGEHRREADSLVWIVGSPHNPYVIIPLNQKAGCLVMLS